MWWGIFIYIQGSQDFVIYVFFRIFIVLGLWSILSKNLSIWSKVKIKAHFIFRLKISFYSNSYWKKIKKISVPLPMHYISTVAKK